MNRVISFSSGKGGVGKTSLVSNLGYLWAKRGYKTLLIDADWTLGKMGITLGIKPQWTIEQVLKGEISLNQAVQGVSENLSLLASPSGSLGFEELDENTRNQLFFEIDALRDQYELILLDHSSGVHWGVIQFAAAAHQHVVVTTAEPTSYMDAYAIMKILSKRFKIRDFQLVVTLFQNRLETEQIIQRFIDITQSHLDVRVSMMEYFPWEPKIGESIRMQKIFAQINPMHNFTSSLIKLCNRLERITPRETGGLQFFYGDQNNLLPAR